MLGITSAKPRVIANSIPKAGTHLLKKCLSLFPGLSYANAHLEVNLPVEAMSGLLSAAADGGVVTAHLPYQKAYAQLFEELCYKTLLIIRDPRDVAVSFSYYVTNTTDHYLNTYYRNLSSDDERLMVSIVGIREKLVPGAETGLRTCNLISPDFLSLETGENSELFLQALSGINDLYKAFLKWSAETTNCTVRFESLIGPTGGGSRETQVREIGRIAKHLGVRLSTEDVECIAEGTFDPKSPTFRQGIVGDWKNHFSPEHKKVFKDMAGRLLIDLGYEKNLEW
jgi:hypothetical protein